MDTTSSPEIHINPGNSLQLSGELVVYAVTGRKQKEIFRDKAGTSSVVKPSFNEIADFFYVVLHIENVSHKGEEIRLQYPTQFVTVFTQGDNKVSLSEQATIATAWAFAQFTCIEGDDFRIQDPFGAWQLAYAMCQNFVSVEGNVSDVISTSPNGLETNSWPMFNSLSNLLYDTLINTNTADRLLGLTESNSIFAAFNTLATRPFTEASEIYALTEPLQEVFSPSLTSLELPSAVSPAPDQWSLTIKRNDSGAKNFMIAGVGYGVFDKNDRIWLTNNFRQGTDKSSTFCVILEPDGSPAKFSPDKQSPLFGGGLLGAGFGVAVNPDGDRIAFGNYGWGGVEWNPQHGGVSVFDSEGNVLSPPNGFNKGLSRVQGMAYDAKGNLWMASWGTQDPMPPVSSKYHYPGANSAIVVSLASDNEVKLDTDNPLVYHFEHPSPHNLTFDVAIDEDDFGYVSNAGQESSGTSSTVYKMAIEGKQLVKKAMWPKSKEHGVDRTDFETLRQIAVHPNGEILVVGVTSSRVVRLNKQLVEVGEFTQNVDNPWGITVDGNGDLFVASFAPDENGSYGITLVRDMDDSTGKLMTLPTGGEEVRLSDGMPLYGNTGHQVPSSPEKVHRKSYDPLMRLTGTNIDRAGNLWAFNNWKPSALTDAVFGNPGGDGVVIFVGIAKPRRTTDH